MSNNSIDDREEIKLLRTSAEINKELTGLAKSSLRPKVNSFVDFGGQGFDFKVNKNTPYVFFGFAMQWDIFSGGKNKLKIKQADIGSKIIASQTDYVTSQLNVQLNNNINAFNASVSLYEFSLIQENTSLQVYSDMLKIYKEGQALFIELLDAQNQLINARLQSNIALYEAWIKATDIERSSASFNLNLN